MQCLQTRPFNKTWFFNRNRSCNWSRFFNLARFVNQNKSFKQTRFFYQTWPFNCTWSSNPTRSFNQARSFNWTQSFNQMRSFNRTRSFNQTLSFNQTRHLNQLYLFNGEKKPQPQEQICGQRSKDTYKYFAEIVNNSITFKTALSSHHNLQLPNAIRYIRIQLIFQNIFYLVFNWYFAVRLIYNLFSDSGFSNITGKYENIVFNITILETIMNI